MDERLNSAAWLRAAYVKNGWSLASIADELGCHRNTVRNQFIKFSIPRRERGAHFVGKPKPIEQRRKMAAARRRYWKHHPDRTEFKLKISRSKRKTGTMRGRPYIYIIGRGYVAVHRIIAETKLGRRLRSDEAVHHIDGNIANNDSANIEILSNADHSRLHTARRKRDRSGRLTK